MSKQTESLKLALEALEVATTPLAKDRQEVLRAQAAIREALAEQPAQQQVPERMKQFVQRHHITSAEFTAFHVGFCCGEEFNKQPAQQQEMKCRYCAGTNFSLVDGEDALVCDDCGHEPAQQEPVGAVTVGHHKGLENHDFDYWGILPDGTHNLYTSPPAQQQEPVAWADINALTEQFNSVNCGTAYRLPGEGRQPLYTSPPASKPWVWLTDEEVKNCIASTAYSFEAVDIARAIEAKLREKNA